MTDEDLDMENFRTTLNKQASASEAPITFMYFYTSSAWIITGDEVGTGIINCN